MTRIQAVDWDSYGFKLGDQVHVERFRFYRARQERPYREGYRLWTTFRSYDYPASHTAETPGGGRHRFDYLGVGVVLARYYPHGELYEVELGGRQRPRCRGG